MRTLQAAGGTALNIHGPRATPAAEADQDRAHPPSPSPAPPPATVAAGPRGRAVVVLLGLAAAVLVIDLATKQLAVTELAGAEPVRLLGGAVYLVHVTNSGAAFGLASSYTFIFPVIAFAVIVWIAWMALRLRSVTWAVSLGLVLGGATGNLADRIFRAPGPFVGEVVDMISIFDPNGRVWPVFNGADAALVIGVLLAVWLELTGRRRDGTRVTRTRPMAGGSE